MTRHGSGNSTVPGQEPFPNRQRECGILVLGGWEWREQFGSAFLSSWLKNAFGLYRNIEVLSTVKQVGCLGVEALGHTTLFRGMGGGSLS